MEERVVSSHHHAESLVAYLQSLVRQKRFLDTTILSDGLFVVSAHRLVLATFSTHFHTALQGVQGSATITLDVDPKVTEVSGADLKAIVEFMYSGRVEINATIARSAKALGCSTLVNLLASGDLQPEGTLLVGEDHPAVMLEGLRRYYTEAKFTDVTINCQGVPLSSCHRLVLCAYSEHFEQALLSTERCPLVTLDIDSAITGVTVHDLRTIVEFMYSGALRLPKRRLKSLTNAARALGVSKLVEAVGDSQRLQSPYQSFSGSRELEEDDSRGYVESLGGGDETPFDVDAVGATEDVGSTPIVQDPTMDLMAGMEAGSGVFSEEPSRNLTASDNYVDIYEEYVMGPRRGRRGGTYGGGRDKAQSLTIKSMPRAAKSQVESEEGSGEDVGLFSGGLGDEATTSSDVPGTSEMGGVEEVTAVTMSVAPGTKRKRTVDSYGYGLPEIIGNNDITVPLLVGDQQVMMEKPFKCPYCDHRTKEKSAVEKHIRCIHTLEAPYKCRYCNQAFKVQSNLVRHIRAHTGEKPYVCKKCGAAYADKKNMDAHVYREHLKMKPLECPAQGCSAKFWRQDRFNYHCRRQHAFEPPLNPLQES